MNNINIENLIENISFEPKSINFPNSWVGHKNFGAWIIKTSQPKIFVELGTHSGNSFFCFCQSVSENSLETKCFAVDTWRGDPHAGDYDENVFLKLVSHNKNNYATFSTLLRMTFDEALNQFEDNSIGLLHIDGLHTYEAVKHDFETWLPKMEDGGVVLFHDINEFERGFGVWKLWEELKEKYPRNMEFSHSHGLGVLQITLKHTHPKNSWLEDGIEKKMLQQFFSNIGILQENIIVKNYEKKLLKKDLVDSQVHIRNLESNLENIDQKLLLKEKKISELVSEIVQKDILITNLYSSTSWRVSFPIRVLGTQLQRLKRIYSLYKISKKRKIKLTEILKKVSNVYRMDGFEGIKNLVIRFEQNGGKSANDIYLEWLEQYDLNNNEYLEFINSKIKVMRIKPLISIIMPTYNSNLKFLKEAINSVISQSYQNWELCIADDASTKIKVRDYLKNISKNDPRIKVIFREKNGHISAASNSAISLASGDWIALLDHDDTIHKHALFWIATGINNSNSVSLIYTDEDKLNSYGKRESPYFKTDWNRHLFYSHNMVCHFGVYKKTLIDKLGGFREGVEGAQDYDLALRAIEIIDPSDILHIPKVLYHWRMHSQSTSQSSNAKPYAMKAGERALNEHFQRIGLKAESKLEDYSYKTIFHLHNNEPLVSLIIPTRNGFHYLKKCIESIIDKTSYKNYEIIIVDNGSNEKETLDYINYLDKTNNVKIIRDDKVFNFSALNNLAVSHTKGQIVGLINNDVEVINREWLTEMVSLAIQPNVGAVGAKLYYSDKKIQHAGVILGIGGVAGHSHKGFPFGSSGHSGRLKLLSEFSAVTAACLLISKNKYLEVGGLNELDLKIAFNDVDFCLKLREKGYKNVFTPFAELYHHESISRGYEDSPEKQARFLSEINYMQRTWGDILLNDPFYNPNLTLKSEDFGLAFPPRESLL